jgi:ANTAR domain-containing protein
MVSRRATEQGGSRQRGYEPIDLDAYRRAVEQLPREDLVAELARLRERVAQLHVALDSRAIIEEAKGVLGERLGLSMEDAFELLRFAARSDHLRIHDLAGAVVRDKQTPQPIVRALAHESRRRGLQPDVPAASNSSRKAW